MKKNNRGPLGLLLALCMTLLLVTPALAGVTDVTGGSKTTVNTVVRNNYTDTHEKKTFALTGKTTTFEGAAGYFGAESGTLTVGFPDLREVEITYTVSVDTVVMTVTNYDDLPDGTYTCPQREDKTMMTTIYTGSKLTYTGTDCEDGKVTINEIRDDYYNRHHIWRGYTLTVMGETVTLTAEQSAKLAAAGVESRSVTAGVRPVHISLGESGIPAEVDVSELMGSELHLHLAANGQDVVAVIPTANIDPMAYARHTAVKFGFDAKLVHLFDSDSEKNLI